MSLETWILLGLGIFVGIIAMAWNMHVAKKYDRIQRVTEEQQNRSTELLERQERLVERIERIVDMFEKRSTQS
jgi:uncharacterized membrane-anchored protein YhcB (DUF1043 family)